MSLGAPIKRACVPIFRCWLAFVLDFPIFRVSQRTARKRDTSEKTSSVKEAKSHHEEVPAVLLRVMANIWKGAFKCAAASIGDSLSMERDGYPLINSKSV